MSETKLEKTIEEYSKLGKENKNIDVASLMLSALKNEKQNEASPKMKRWAYLVSLGLPPLGLLFALKFYFGDEDDARKTAYICVLLTIASFILLWWTSKLVFTSSGTSVQQIEQIKPSDIYQLTQ